ncbi:MAG: hypothetical protein AAB152_09725 [Candidatus Coatesbacteria bacterium]
MTARRKLPRIDLARVRTIPLKSRPSKVSLALLGSAPRKGASWKSFERGLPRILAAGEFTALADAIAAAARRRKTVLWMIGAHVIKTGLSPVLLELMRRRALTALAMNGAGSIHDFEMARNGATSEDVAAGLKDGTFGMARETGEFFARALGRRLLSGYGEAVGAAIADERLPNRRISLLHEMYQAGLPATVHVAIGTDITHAQPSARGEDIGRATHEDFRTLCAVAATLEGGVVINVGSAVVLPEVFLKALTVARNLGHPVRKFTAANLDMIQHYRPNLNVVQRPTQLGGRRIVLTGHHELMVPMLAQAIIERL